jgi:hypothetical protein
MGKFIKIQSEFIRQIRLILILDLITIFCIFYLTFIILNVDYFLEKSTLISQIPANFTLLVLALVISIIGAFLLHRKDKKINVAMLIESSHSQLNERLRTAIDNRNENNVIIVSLKDYVSDALGKVSSSQLFKKRSIDAKILISIISILAIALVVFNPGITVPPEDVAKIAENIGGAMGILNNDTSNAIKNDQTNEPDIAIIEGIPVDMSLKEGEGHGNMPKDYTIDQNQFIRSTMFPIDIFGSNVSDGGYGALNKKSEAEKELINRYAVEISKK